MKCLFIKIALASSMLLASYAHAAEEGAVLFWKSPNSAENGTWDVTNQIAPAAVGTATLNMNDSSQRSMSGTVTYTINGDENVFFSITMTVNGTSGNCTINSSALEGSNYSASLIDREAVIVGGNLTCDVNVEYIPPELPEQPEEPDPPIAPPEGEPIFTLTNDLNSTHEVYVRGSSNAKSCGDVMFKVKLGPGASIALNKDDPRYYKDEHNNYTGDSVFVCFSYDRAEGASTSVRHYTVAREHQDTCDLKLTKQEGHKYITIIESEAGNCTTLSDEPF